VEVGVRGGVDEAVVGGAALADTARAAGTAVLRTYTLGVGLVEPGDAELDVEGAEAAAGTARRDGVVCNARVRGRAEWSVEDTRRDVGAMASVLGLS
jgi:hypothetical protein